MILWHRTNAHDILQFHRNSITKKGPTLIHEDIGIAVFDAIGNTGTRESDPIRPTIRFELMLIGIEYEVADWGRAWSLSIGDTRDDYAIGPQFEFLLWEN